MSDGFPFLNLGVMMECFHSVGRSLVSRRERKMVARGNDKVCEVLRKNIEGKLSGPAAECFLSLEVMR